MTDDSVLAANGGRWPQPALRSLLRSLPAAVAAAPFWFASSLTRSISEAVRLGPTVTPWPELLRYVPEIGWHSRPDLDAFALADHVFHITTDAEGWRGHQSIEGADVLVFGDSYAFGHGVNDDDIYAHHTDGVVVKPLGSDGYSMVHAVLWMERLQPRITDKVVVWMVYPGNDLHDNLRPNYGRYRMPFIRQREGQWELYTEHVSEEPWPCDDGSANYPKELAKLCTPGSETDRALAGAAYLVEKAAGVCREAGAALVVLSVPRREQIDEDRIEDLRAQAPQPERFDPSLLDAGLLEACAAAGVPFVALSEVLVADDYQVADIHWTPAGNAKVGRWLAQRYRDEWRGLTGSASVPTS